MSSLPARYAWLFFGLVLVGILHLSSMEMRAYADELRLELRAVEEEHQRLEDRFAHLRDLSEIERLAREQLGYVRPGEIIFTFGEK